MKINEHAKFILCLDNRDCDDLQVGKVYRTIPDASAAREGYVRIVDDSGEDYLYPDAFFVAVRIPQKAEAVLAAAA